MKTSPPLKHQEEDTGFGQLIENTFDFLGGHLAMVVMVEVAMNAALVAAIGDVDVNGETGRPAPSPSRSFPSGRLIAPPPFLASDLEWGDRGYVRRWPCCALCKSQP
jgi:hypothetical protein